MMQSTTQSISETIMKRIKYLEAELEDPTLNSFERNEIAQDIITLENELKDL